MEQDNPARQAAIEEAIRRMEWESGIPTINPDEGRILDERQDPTHPLRKGRIKPDTTEIAETVDQTGQP